MTRMKMIPNFSLQRLLLPLLLLFFSTTVTTASDDLCNLCSNGVSGILYPSNVLQADSGMTCTSLALQMAEQYAPDSWECYQEIADWRYACCQSDEAPAAMTFSLSNNNNNQNDIPTYDVIGEYPVCDVCRDGDYPSQTSMVLTMLYIGTGSCVEYYKIGQQGLVQTHLCSTLQYFAYEPCGCGEFNTNNHPYDDDDDRFQDHSSRPSGSAAAKSNNNRWTILPVFGVIMVVQALVNLIV